MPEEILIHVVALLGSDAKRALRATCKGTRQLANRMCQVLHFQGDDGGAEGMRYIAARCNRWSGVKKLQLSGVAGDTAGGIGGTQVSLSFDALPTLAHLKRRFMSADCCREDLGLLKARIAL